jgi:hypothetical protein
MGRWVAFTSTATNLVPGLRTPNGGLFLRDRLDGTTIAVPWVDGPAFPADVEAAEPALSADGTVVAFTAVFTQANTADGIVPYVLTWDRTTGIVEVVSLGPNQQPTPGYQPTISADGRFVAYTQWFVDRTPPVPTNLTTSSAAIEFLPCGPESATISATVTDPDDAVTSVTLFYAWNGGGTTSQTMTLRRFERLAGHDLRRDRHHRRSDHLLGQATDSHGNTSGRRVPSRWQTRSATSTASADDDPSPHAHSAGRHCRPGIRPGSQVIASVASGPAASVPNDLHR